MNFKKLLIVSCFVAGLCSCTEDSLRDDIQDASLVEITAVIADGNARTSLGTEASGSRKVLWEADDRVALFDDTSFAREFSLTSAAGSNSGTFKGNATADFASSTYYAVYPLSAAKKVVSEGVEVALNATQTRADGGDTPMVGLTAANGSVNFSAICGLLEFRLTGLATTLESITITSKTAALSGTALVTVAGSAMDVIVTGEKSVSLVLPEPVSLNSTVQSFFVALPAGNYPAGNLKITFKTVEDTFEYTSTVAHNLVRSHIKPISGLNIAIEPEYIDLTAGEAYANCFVVPEKGWYSFDARTRGGFVTVAHPKSGSVVSSIGGSGSVACTAWESTAGMLSNVMYDKLTGKVKFFYSGDKGNAMITMVDSNGKVQWNWHIWATDTPKEQKIGSHTYLDRNVGAWAVPTDAADGWNYMQREWDSAKAVYPTAGLLYQWGRPVPFPPGGLAHLRNSGAYAREHYTVVFADEGCETSATATSDPTYGDTPVYNCPSSSILGSVYTDKSATAVSGTWKNRWWYVNNTTDVSFLTAMQNPMKTYGTAASNEPIALKGVKVQNYYVEDCAPKKYWCNDLFNGSFDFASAHSPWNYAAQKSMAFDVCPYGYRIADAGKAIADYATLGLKWRHQNASASVQAEGFIPSGQTVYTGAAYATAGDGSLVWIPTSGARAFYGAYADMSTIGWWGASNNNKVAAISFAPDASYSASVVVKDGYCDVGAGSYTYNGTTYPITDQNKIEETSISLAMAVRCVKYTATDEEENEDPSNIPVEDLEQVVDGNEW